MEDEKSLSKRELHEKHDLFIQELARAQSVQQDVRTQCLQDRRFATISGAQWEGPLSSQYACKPRMEVNKIHLSLLKIMSEYRNNRITVDFSPKDDRGSEDLADLCDGMYRTCEQDSNAKEAYDNAFDEGTSGGIGAWRYTTEYIDDSDPDDDRQHILIEPIHDADSCVYFDLGAKRQDKSDAKRCYVLEACNPCDFEDEWGYLPSREDFPASVGKLIPDYDFDWTGDDAIYIAEVYEMEEKTEKLYIWELVDGEQKRLTQDEHDAKKGEMKALQAKLKKVKKVKRKAVHKYLMSGDRILEDCGYVAGDMIPITMFYGKRWVIDNIERCMGHVRLAKDAQRLKNMQISSLAEIVTFSPVEKPIFLPEQVLPHAQRWADDNVENYPYLLVDPIVNSNGELAPMGPVGYTKPPAVPPALAALLQITENDIQELLGNTQDGEKMVGDISTQTAELIQTKLDMQTFIYLSNFASAMQHGGRIWLGMAKEVYVEPGRKVKTINERGETGYVPLAEPQLDSEGIPVVANDLANARMDVFAGVGPASSTMKKANIRILTQMLQYVQDPESQQVISSTIMTQMEGAEIDELRDFFRMRLVRMGAADPTQAEQQKLSAEQEAKQANPGPEAAYLLAEAEKARADAAESQADVILKQANADKARADTVQTMQEVDMAKQQQALEAIDRLGPTITPPNVTGVNIDG